MSVVDASPLMQARPARSGHIRVYADPAGADDLMRQLFTFTSGRRVR